MDISTMTLEQVEERLSAIAVEKDNENADFEALTDEVRALGERKDTLLAEVEQRKKDMESVLNGAGENIIKFSEERKALIDINEYRNSKEYMEILAEGIKNQDFTEVREALLTTNVQTGTIALPTFVYDIVKTAWDRNEIMRYVRKLYVKGNVDVNFEVSGTDAVMHLEGSGEVAEEELIEGIIHIIPQYFKKWKSFSKNVMAMRGEEFIRYIYDELAYRTFKTLADTLIEKIAALPQTATGGKNGQVNAAKITVAPAVDTVAKAIAELSDEASNPIVVMNKSTWGVFKEMQYKNGYFVDVFEGLEVHFNSKLPAYNSAATNNVYAIVGDFGEGALANFPDGENLDFIFDEVTRKKENMVEILGEIYAGVEAVNCRAFTLIAKPAQA